jgi:DNA-binding NarL/FixJ family response regulator
MPIRILVADDDPTIRMLLRRLLETHPCWQVCGEATNGSEAVEQAAVLTPDVVILDFAMPLKNGLQAARELSQNDPKPRMLLISVQEISKAVAAAARQAGFRGAVMKSSGTEVVRGVEALLREEDFFPLEGSVGVA